MRKFAKIMSAGVVGAAILAFGLSSADSAVRSVTAAEFHACLTTKTHGLSKVVYRSSPRRCGKGQRAVAWSARGATGARGAAGARGARGATGSRGATGPVGPSVVYASAKDEVDYFSGDVGYVTVITKVVPAGTYAVNAKLVALNTDSRGEASFFCFLYQGDSLIDGTSTDGIGVFDSASLALQGVVTTTGGTINVHCRQDGSARSALVRQLQLSAIQVGASR